MFGPIRDGISRFFKLGLRRPRDARRDADEELESHLAERAAVFVARGMTPEEARDEAHRRLGRPIEDVRRALRRSAEHRERRMMILEWLSDAAIDVRYALRGARREPLFFGFVAITLALGIGFNAATFGVADRVLVRGPAHIVEPDRVVRLFWTMRTPAGREETVPTLDRALTANLAVESHAFAAIGQTARPRPVLFGPDDNLRYVQASSVTPSFFAVVGTRPALGRFFVESEGVSGGADRVVVLSYGIWQSDFGGDPSIVGRAIAIGSIKHTVVGVAPRAFTGAYLDRVDLWFPLQMRTDAAARLWRPNSHTWGPHTVARLKPGVTLADAGADATNAHRRTYTAGEKDWADGRVSAAPLRFGDAGVESDEARIAKWLVALSIIVLFAAGANIVNLLLARAARRRRELAVRVSLGAGRSRLVRLLLAEAMTVTLVGGLAAVVVAIAVGSSVQRLLLPSADWKSDVIDLRVLGLTAVITALTGGLIGVLPALRAGRDNVARALRASWGDDGSHRSTIRALLTASQAAFATMLLFGASLFVLSFQRVRAVDLGVQLDRVVEISPSLQPIAAEVVGEARERETARRRRFALDVLARVKQLPGVDAAAIASGHPFGNTGNYSSIISAPGRDSLPRLTGDSRFTTIVAVSPEYFATVGTQILRGRAFSNDDRVDAPQVIVVNRSMADAVWPARDPIGQCLFLAGPKTPCAFVVGVAEDVHRREVRELPAMLVYIPIAQAADQVPDPMLIVRPHGDASAAIPSLQRSVAALDPTIRYVTAGVLQERLDPQYRTWRVGAAMFSLFAGLALSVAAVGLFGVVAYLVERRRHEIGVRVALGARRSDVVAMMARGAVTTTAAGVLVGGATALALQRFAQPLLYETDAGSPTILGMVALTLLVVAFVAGGIPALRAGRVDPMEALRDG
jgi:predicted permease